MITGGPSNGAKVVCMFATYIFREGFPLFEYSKERFEDDLKAKRISPLFDAGGTMAFENAITVFCAALLMSRRNDAFRQDYGLFVYINFISPALLSCD